MTKDDILKLREAIANHLDTTDKRSMFLRCMFNDTIRGVAARVVLQGTSEYCAMDIVDFFEKQCRLDSLAKAMNKVFELKLNFENKEEELKNGK
jgi:hypothetical protein